MAAVGLTILPTQVGKTGTHFRKVDLNADWY